MGISGSDPALMFTLSAVGRSGATRSGYHSSRAFVHVAGTDRTTAVQVGSVEIRDALDQEPNVAHLRVDGFTPAAGETITIRLGSTNNRVKLFGGRILTTRKLYREDDRQNVAYDLDCIDPTWELDHTIVRGRFTSSAADVIIASLVSSFASGFTTGQVVAGLPSLGEIIFTEERFSDAMTRIMRRAGGYWDVDYDKDIRAFLSDTGQTPKDLVDAHVTLRDVDYDEDLSQITTRVYVEGQGTTLPDTVEIGQTTVPVDDAAIFASGGGSIKNGPQIATYTGKVAGGGASNSVGDSLTLPTAPTTAIPATRVEAGPLGTLTYLITFVTADGETPVGSASSSVAPAQVSAPGGFTVNSTTGGSMGTGQYDYRMTYVTADGETDALGGGAGLSLSGGNNAVDLSSLPVPTDERVTSKNLYRSKVDGGDASMGLVTNLANATTTHSDTIADTALGVAMPFGNSTSGERVALTSVVVSADARVTDRNVYRKRSTETVYRFVGAVGDNTTTTFNDDLRDAALGDEPPAISSVAAAVGSTTLRVAELSVFSGSGGWVLAGQQLMRYTGRSASSGEGNLTGLPASGVGSILSPIEPDAPVIEAPHLTGVPASGAGSVTIQLEAGDEVNVYVQRDDASKQSTLATTLGGGHSGIVETFVQDRRLSITECQNRGDAVLARQGTILKELSWASRDILTRSGKNVTTNLTSPQSIVDTFKIQSVAISQIDEIPSTMPLYRAHASTMRFSFEDLIRQVRERSGQVETR